MSFTHIAIVVALLVFVGLLIRAAIVLGRKPYQRMEEEKYLSGVFPPNVPWTEKLRLMQFVGVAPENPKRIWFYALLAIVAVVILVLLPS